MSDEWNLNPRLGLSKGHCYPVERSALNPTTGCIYKMFAILVNTRCKHVREQSLMQTAPYLTAVLKRQTDWTCASPSNGTHFLESIFDAAL